MDTSKIRIRHKNTDITELISKFVWSGSLNTVARKVEFEIATSSTDKHLPKVTIKNGESIFIVNENKILYRGIVFSRDLSTNSAMRIVTYDYSIFLVKNQATYNFKKMKPRQIVSRVSGLVGVKLGSIANPNVKITRIFENTSLYDVIATAYTIASKSNNIKYNIYYEDDKLHIKEIGKTKAKMIISEDSHIYSSSYSESIEDMKNRVVAYNDKGKRLGVVENKSDKKNYGMMQTVFKGKGGLNAAKSELKRMERNAKIEAIGEVDCIAGNAVQIREKTTGLIGEFFIISDTHTFENNTHTMSLDLSFNKIMDEKMAGNKPEKKKG